MDTKLKKSKMVVSWLSFFIGATLLISGVYFGTLLAWESQKGDTFISDVKYYLSGEITELSYFRFHMGNQLGNLAKLVENTSSIYYRDYELKLSREGSNLAYYAVNDQTKAVAGNNAVGWSMGEDNFPILSKDFSYGAYYKGSVLYIYQNGAWRDVSEVENRDFITASLNNLPSYVDLNSLRLFLGVKKDLTKPSRFTMTEDSLYAIKLQSETVRTYLLICGAGGIFALLLLIYAYYSRRDKRLMDRLLAGKAGKAPLEIKLLVTLILLLVVFGTMAWAENPFVFLFGLLVLFWWLYVLAWDVLIHKKDFLSNSLFQVVRNVLKRLTDRYLAYERRFPLEKRRLDRFRIYMAAQALILTLMILCLLGSLSHLNVYGTIGWQLPLFFLLLATEVYGWIKWAKQYIRQTRELAALVEHIEVMGDSWNNEALSLSFNSELYPAASSLNRIGERVVEAVEQRIKSERQKIDLVTNVSHDLKTPLTSIISYVNLLEQEELPLKSAEYVRILTEKSERLKILIQDLFDLSKATSGNMPLTLEKLDLAKLLRQTMADMDEAIRSSGLIFRLNIPNTPVPVTGDGSKLYRALANLIQNALNYSMPRSRVFIELTAAEDTAVVTLKNTSGYEMDFTAEEIMERFVRGDKARTTEGSGLGLAISKSFVNLCGGKLTIATDGDLFKVSISLPLYL